MIGEDEPKLICLKDSRALTSDLSSESLRKIRYIRKTEPVSFHTIVKVPKGEENVA